MVGGLAVGDAGLEEERARSGFARLAGLIEDEQERWFLWLPVAFGSGIAGYFALRAEPALWMLAFVGVVAALAHGFGRHAGLLSLLTMALLAAALGGLVAKLRTELMAAPVLVRQIGPVDVTGWIELVEPRPTAGQRITVVTRSIAELSDADRPYRVRVRTRTAEPGLAPGQAVRFKATLAGPASPAAPGDFDFGRLAWYQGLGGIGLATARIAADSDAGEPPVMLRVRASIEGVRQAIGRRITAALPGEVGAIANALITGERGGISEVTNQAYRDSGLFHILSISGLHMVIMAGAVFYMLRLVFAAIPPIALRYPIKKWAAVAAIAAAIGYTLISGAAFATVRSAIMITIMFLAVILDRPALALRNVALAALVILIVFPESLLDAGFQMSFAAVVGLVSAYEWLAQRRLRRVGQRNTERGLMARGAGFIGEIFLSTIIASLAVAPFAIYHFHNTQQLALIGNAIAIPICNLIVMPAALAALVAMPFGLERWPLVVMGQGIDAMSAIARWVAALPGAVLKVASIPTMSFALMVAGGLWLTLWSRGWRVLGIIPVALGLLFAPGQLRPDILVGRDGTTVAVRDKGGRLSALASRGSSFELARWLEADGDRRTASDAAAAMAFRCDPLGCVGESGGRRVVIAANAAAFRDDCATAGVIILKVRRTRGCGVGGATVLIDPASLEAEGAHAVYLTGATPVVATVRATRGDRPWSRRIERPRSAPRDGDSERVAGFAGLERRFREPPRPEIEDENWPRSKPEVE